MSAGSTWDDASIEDKVSFAESNYTKLLSGYAWDTKTITYSFPLEEFSGMGWYLPEGEEMVYTAFTEAEIAVTMDFMEMIERFLDVDFVYDATGAGAMKFGHQNMTMGGYAAYPYYGSDHAVVIGTPYEVSPEAHGLEILIHEVGHSLGLKHSHDEPNTVDHELDIDIATVMSYSSFEFYGGADFHSITSFSLMDIYALQSLYGVSTLQTDDVYTATNHIYTIADFGGYDTIDVGVREYDQTDVNIIDLARGYVFFDVKDGGWQSVRYDYESGEWSDWVMRSAENGFYNMVITPGSVIEEVIGSAVSDIINGGDAGENVMGGGGSDTITGGKGDDIIDAGAGADVAVVSGAFADYTIIENEDGSFLVSDNAGTDGTDRLTGVETLRFTDRDVRLNHAPTVLNPISNQVLVDGEFYSRVVPSDTFSDPDGDLLTFSATLEDGSDLPAWLTFDAATQTFSGRPLETDVGSYLIKLTASDGDRSVFDVFNLTVGDVENAPHVRNEIADATATENAPFVFVMPEDTFEEFDGDAMTYTATLASGDPLPDWLTFDAATRTFSGTPGDADVGVVSVMVTASDGALTASDTFEISVADVLNAPVVATGIANQEATEGQLFTFVVPEDSFADADHDVLTFSATTAGDDPLPDWLTFDPATRTFSGTPVDADIRALAVNLIAIKVTVSDGTQSVSEIFTITLNDVEHAPVLTMEIADQTATEGDNFAFTVPADTFADLDDDVLTLTATLSNGDALPAWLTFDADSRTFWGVPADGDVGVLSVRVTAADDLQSVSDTFDITVGDVEFAPALALELADQDATEGLGFSYTVPADAFYDLDGDTLDYSATLASGDPLPAWLSFDAATRTFSGMPADGDVGIISVKVVASDGTLTGSDTFDITIADVQSAPVVAASIADQAVVEGDIFMFIVPEGTFSDPDGDVLTYTATLANGDPLPDWLSFAPAGLSFIGVPGSDDVGTLSVMITASDSTKSVSEVFDITVSDFSYAPMVAVPLADQSAIEGQAFAFSVPADSFWDFDGDVLTYTATLANGDPLPDWLSFDAATATFSGTPADGDVGLVSVTVAASDATQSASDTFDITIGDVQNAPVLSAALADQGAAEGQVFSFAVPAGSFADADGDALSYTATLANGDPLPDWLSFDAATATFSGTPASADIGVVSVKITASDGTQGISDIFDITVSDRATHAPVVSAALVDQSAIEGESFSFVIPESSFADADDDALSYTATLANGDPLPDWLSFDAAAATFSGTPSAADIGIVSVKVIASDGTQSASDIFDITIADGVHAPDVVNPIADLVLDFDTPLLLQVPDDAFADADGNALSYSASLANGDALPDWLTFDSATRTFSGTPGIDAVGVLSVRVTASDGALSAFDVFDIAIADGTRAPTLAHPIDDTQATEGVAFTFQIAENTFADPNGDALTYTATLANGNALPDWLTFDAATRAFSGMPTDADAGILSIKVTASDGAQRISDIFDITIADVARAPVLASAIADQSAREGANFSFVVPEDSFIDADGDPLTYSATLADGSAMPDWLSFDAATRTFSGMPADADAGLISVRVTASDGTDVASDTFDITIADVVHAPVVAAAIADQAAAEGELFTFVVPEGSFADVDGDALTYSATQADGSALPDWLTFDAATLTFSGRPGTADGGVVSVKVTASDGGAAVSDIFDIDVALANVAPVATTDKVRISEHGRALVDVVANDRDADGDELDIVDVTVKGNGLSAEIEDGEIRVSYKGADLDAGERRTVEVRYTIDDGSEESTGSLFVKVKGQREAGDDIVGDGRDNDLVGTNASEWIGAFGGADALKGRGGSDWLDGGRGSDVLWGGDGADVFVFGARSGSDIVSDFSIKDGDRIDLSDVRQISDFADLMSRHMYETADGLAILITGKDRILIEDVSRYDLDKGDFIL